MRCLTDNVGSQIYEEPVQLSTHLLTRTEERVDVEDLYFCKYKLVLKTQ